MSIKLLNVIDKKNNNFNLIRMIAAIAVIYSHSFPLAMGEYGHEPIKNIIGMTLGSIAVDIFFIISGLLVTRSLLYRRNIFEFIIARVLRIYPALLVAIFFCVVGGIFFSSLSVYDYFSHPDLKKFIFFNGFMIGDDYQFLPGVFTTAPLNNKVNGSFWTLPWELRMYLLLVCLGIGASIIRKKYVKVDLLPFTIVTIGVVSLLLFLLEHFFTGILSYYAEHFRFLTEFFIGGTLYILRSYIVLMNKLGWSLFILLVFSMVNQDFFFVLYMITLPYLILCLAYLPRGKILNYNKLGDYSYGTYIYAWPVQQVLAVLIVGITPFSMMITTFVITLILAVTSWHFVERPMLALKQVLHKKLTNI